MKWISIKDKMPDPYETVIVTDGHELQKAHYISGYRIVWVLPGPELVDEDKITHWAICPELPNND